MKSSQSGQLPKGNESPQGSVRRASFAQLEPLAARLNEMEGDVASFCKDSDPALSQKARKLRKKISDFEPSVTFIGQVKAGKTTLINAMIGWADLLPADINPWTSVVTSVHLSPRSGRNARRSSFRFFSNEEWEHLIRQGGRVGELANRAGAEVEITKVRAQMDELRERSKKRLGRHFEMLLGQTHDYDALDAELVKRYVCMGDEFWGDDDTSRETGRFADITKSADVWFARPDLPTRLCVKDTPGVNDTFMIREQITINALRGSRLCVLVLSAQQALSSVDMGLIRLISNIRAREIVIFVNRIDELQNPAREVPEIRESIRATLRMFNSSEDVEIIFGSAFWAEQSVAETLDELGAASGEALINWAEACLEEDVPSSSPSELIWALSGLPALERAIADRVASAVTGDFLPEIERELDNLRTGAAALRDPRSASSGAPCLVLSESEVKQRFDQLTQEALGRLDARLTGAVEVFDQRALSAQRSFLNRATGDLLRHLELYGEGEVWSYDPNGLRVLLRTAYKVFSATAQKAATEAAKECCEEIRQLLAPPGRTGPEGYPVVPPHIPKAEAPVSIAQTIALDLKSGWWTRFWRQRRGYEAYAEQFSRLIAEETAPMTQRLRSESVEVYCKTLRDAVSTFLDDQSAIARSLASASESAHSPPRPAGAEILPVRPTQTISQRTL